MGAFGFFGQSPEEREAGMLAEQEKWEEFMQEKQTCPLGTCPSPELCNDLSACDAKIIEEDQRVGYLETGAEAPVLGPVYFSARDFAERLLANFNEAGFKPLLEKAAAEFREKLWDDVQDHLRSDSECNVQGFIWHEVDNIVKALLSGERWAMERYVLGPRYDCEKVRAAVAAHLGPELLAARVKDLEAEVKRMEERLEINARIREV